MSSWESAGAENEHNVAVVVAHPDDETLWAGGLILSHPDWSTTIVSLCRATDADRAPKFRRVCAALGAKECKMGDLDDGPDQLPLAAGEAERAVLELLPKAEWDLVITHSPEGEYTRHLRHEEAAFAVARLWSTGQIVSREVLMFAYNDADRSRAPEVLPGADLRLVLPQEIFLKKYSLITDEYGFEFESWEAMSTPRVEGFWRFEDSRKLFERFGDSHPAQD